MTQPPLSPVEVALLGKIASASGLALYYGITRSRVHQWVRHKTFPAPLEVPNCHTVLWHLDQVEAWRQRPEAQQA